MANFKASKIVSALPGTLVADTIYFVRVGAGFDMYVTDSTGLLAFTPNQSGGGLTDGDKGDVTVSGGGTVITVNADANLGQMIAISNGSFTP